jgi:endonuclease YncB( thermonuclease family)
MKPNYCYKATILKVIDGDTLKLNIDVGFHFHVHVSIRLLNVLAPELPTKRGNQIAIALRAQLPIGTAVTVATHRQDKYGRWLGTVWQDEVEVNDLINSYMAEVQDE